MLWFELFVLAVATVIVPAVAVVNGLAVIESEASTGVAVTFTLPVPFTLTVAVADELSTQTLLGVTVAFPDTLNAILPASPVPFTVTVTLSPTFALDFENDIVNPAALDFGILTAIIKIIINVTIKLLITFFIVGLLY